MSLAFHWFLPTYGDSRNLVAGGHGTAMHGDRPATLRYLHQICAAAEDNGFEAVLTPTGLWCEDAWLTKAMLIEGTETLKFLVAFRPGLLSPTLAAQMAGTFQRHSGGRLLLNVVTGGEPHEQRAYGDFLDKESRYRSTVNVLSRPSAQGIELVGHHEILLPLLHAAVACGLARASRSLAIIGSLVHPVSSVAATSSQTRYSSAAPELSAGWTATSPGGSCRIVQPPPASTDGVPSRPARKARSASASVLERTRWAPVITAPTVGRLPGGQVGSRRPCPISPADTSPASGSPSPAPAATWGRRCCAG